MLLFSCSVHLDKFTAECLCVSLCSRGCSHCGNNFVITAKLYFLQGIDLYLPLTPNHWALVAGLEAQYLYLQFPLIIGFWEQSYRSATHTLPSLSHHHPPHSPSKSLFSWDLAIYWKIPWVLQMNPAVTPNAKKPEAIEVNHSLNSASHPFFFVLFYPPLFLGPN